LDVKPFLPHPKVDREYDKDRSVEGGEYHVIDGLDDEDVDELGHTAPGNGTENEIKHEAEHKAPDGGEQSGKHLRPEHRPPAAAAKSECAAYRLRAANVLEHHNGDGKVYRKQEPDGRQERPKTEDDTDQHCECGDVDRSQDCKNHRDDDATGHQREEDENVDPQDRVQPRPAEAQRLAPCGSLTQIGVADNTEAHGGDECTYEKSDREGDDVAAQQSVPVANRESRAIRGPEPLARRNNRSRDGGEKGGSGDGHNQGRLCEGEEASPYDLDGRIYALADAQGTQADCLLWPHITSLLVVGDAAYAATARNQSGSGGAPRAPQPRRSAVRVIRPAGGVAPRRF
jgi:hypothetical protein